jgi:hypothetical protein
MESDGVAGAYWNSKEETLVLLELMVLMELMV